MYLLRLELISLDDKTDREIDLLNLVSSLLFIENNSNDSDYCIECDGIYYNCVCSHDDDEGC